jgi:predicted transcriptional regulator
MTGYSETVSFREDKRILELVDSLAAARGTDRSALYREAIRLLLTKMGLLKDPLLMAEAA